jgi:hypothetical protein
VLPDAQGAERRMSVISCLRKVKVFTLFMDGDARTLPPHAYLKTVKAFIGLGFLNHLK